MSCRFTYKLFTQPRFCLEEAYPRYLFIEEAGLRLVNVTFGRHILISYLPWVTCGPGTPGYSLKTTYFRNEGTLPSNNFKRRIFDDGISFLDKEHHIFP